MNYCIKCGNKLKENSKYCMKCGTKVKKQKKELNTQKLILNIGICLIILSSILFAFTSWNSFSKFIKLTFVASETILFFLLAFVSKKLENNFSFKSCYFLGVIFLPLTLLCINYYEFSSVFFEEGPGLYIYLAIISFICFIVYYLSNKFIKSKFYIYMSYISFIISIFFITKSLLLELNVILLLFLLLLTVFNILIKKELIFKNNIKIFNTLINILLIIFSILIFAYLFNFKSKVLFNIFILIIFVFNMYFYSKKSFIKYLNSIILPIILNIYYFLSFQNSLSIYFSILTIIAIFLVSYLYKNEVIKNIATIVLFFSIIILFVISYNSYKAFLILNIFILALAVFIYLIDDEYSMKEVMSLIMPINIYLIVYSLFNLFIKLSNAEVITISSILIYVIYLLTHKKYRNAYIFEIFYVIFLSLSTLLLFENNRFEVVMLINLILWIYYLIINNIYIKKKDLNYIFLVGSIIGMILTFSKLNLSSMFIFLGISIILFLYYELIKKKEIIYFLIGSAFTLLEVFDDFSGHKVFVVFALVLLYVYSYFNINKLDKKYEVYKIISTFLGFLLVNKLIIYFIKPIVIVEILTLFIYLFILIIMYLTDKETNKRILLYSVILLLPYYNLIHNLEFVKNIVIQAHILPIIIYSLVFPEIISFKDSKTVVLVLNILLSILTLNIGILATIFNILLFVLYLFYGINKNDKSIIYFSVIYLVISLLVGLFSMLHSIFILIFVLMVGICLIIYTIINKEMEKKHEIKK